MKIKLSKASKKRREFVKMVAAGGALLYSPISLIGFSRSRFIDPQQEEFLRACHEGNLKQVQKMLGSKSDSSVSSLLSTIDEQGRRGFAIALLAGHKAIGEVIKNAGYKTDLHEAVLDLDWDRYDELIGEESEQTIHQVNAHHPIGGSLMWAAAAGGAGKDVWRVYAKCGDPNLVINRNLNSSPLQIALRYSSLATAELTAASLLSNFTNPNPLPNADMSPLHIAAERGSSEMVEMLIRLGADINMKNKTRDTPLALAKNAGHDSVAQLIENHTIIPRTCNTSRAAFDVDGNTYTEPQLNDVPLFKRGNIVGQAHRDLEGLKKEFANDPRLAHSVATTGEKGVEAGAHMGRKDIVDLFLSNGAPYSMPTAVLLNDFVSVKRMLSEDPNRIHARGAHDFALLWYPIIGGGNIDMMELLLNHGAKIEQQHFLGTTALHWACFRGPIEMIELLIANGADVNRRGRKFNPNGETPLQSARDEKIINYLKSKGAH